MLFQRFVSGIEAELRRQQLEFDPAELRDTIGRAVDFGSYHPLRALREPTHQLWAVRIPHTQLAASDALRRHHDEALWTWSHLVAYKFALALMDWHRVQPTTIHVAGDTTTFLCEDLPVLQVAPVAMTTFLDQEVHRYETLFDGLRSPDTDTVRKRLCSLPGFRGLGGRVHPKHLGREGALIQPTLPGLAKWSKSLIEAHGGKIALHAAQELLSRLLGFADWHQLRHAQRSNVAPQPKVIWDEAGDLVGWYPTAGAALCHLDKLLTRRPLPGACAELSVSHAKGLELVIQAAPSPDRDTPRPLYFVMSTPEEAEDDYATRLSASLLQKCLMVEGVARRVMFEELLGLGDAPPRRLSAADSRLGRTADLTLGAYRFTVMAEDTSIDQPKYLMLERLTASGEHDQATPPIRSAPAYNNQWPVQVPLHKCVIQLAHSTGYVLLGEYGKTLCAQLPELTADQVAQLVLFAGLTRAQLWSKERAVVARPFWQ